MSRRQADIVVVGAGTAGLSAALHAQGRSVLLLSKTAFGAGGSSPLAQGGVAAALGFEDAPRDHAHDTLDAGAGLCHRDVVEDITAEGPRRIAALLELGASFDRDVNGRLALGREGAHGRRRIAHTAGDGTGAEIVKTLAVAVAASRRIEILEHHFAVDLLLDRGRVVGVVALDPLGAPVVVSAGEVVLATGGVGALYSRTTNPAEATGDGLALAARAGARLAGLEFVQFHPTALDVSGFPVPLLTEPSGLRMGVATDSYVRPSTGETHSQRMLWPWSTWGFWQEGQRSARR